MDQIADNWQWWLAAFLMSLVSFAALGYRKFKTGGDPGRSFVALAVLALTANASFILLAIAVVVHLIHYAKM